MFCTMGDDPECNESPYQEPPATMKPGYIALFTLLGVFCLGGIVYYFHRRQMQKQKKRYKRMFARQVAQRIGVAGSVSQLPSEKLLAEFQRIDAGLRNSRSHADGFISRDDLWEFLSDGKAGEISEADFNALFKAIDLKNRGKVNFVEFIAFMSTCSEEFSEVKIKGMGVRNGRALDSAAQRLSVINRDTSPEALVQDEP